MKRKKEIIKILGLCAAMGLLFFFFFTKYLAALYLRNSSGFSLVQGVLELTYVENTGVAFGLFPDNRIFLILLSVAALILFLALYFHVAQFSGNFFYYAALVLLTAGTAGNLVDRVRLGYVIDFIYFSLIHFPVFNVADMCICVGVFLLFIMIFREEEDVLVTGTEGEEITESSSEKK